MYNCYHAFRITHTLTAKQKQNLLDLNLKQTNDKDPNVIIHNLICDGWQIAYFSKEIYRRGVILSIFSEKTEKDHKRSQKYVHPRIA